MFPGKRFITTTLDMIDVKREMTVDMRKRYLMRAGMAGVIVGMLYLANFAITAGFSEVHITPDQTLEPLGKIAGSTFFGFALVFIYYSKSELLTSNMMILTIGRYYRRIRIKHAGRILSLCFLGNFLGGLFVAVCLAASTMLTPGMHEILNHTVEHKLSYFHEGATGWVDLFMRAVFCNFFINLAMLLVYNGFIKDDLVKVSVMIAAVFIFAYLGFEHSVADTVVFTIQALQDGISLVPAAVTVFIALIGNYVGGGVLIGLYYAYVNDQSRWMRQHPEVSEEAYRASAASSAEQVFGRSAE